MAHTGEARGRSPGVVAATVVLVIIGLLAIAAGLIYLAEPAKSLPSILGTITHPAARANDIRPLRGWVALVVGVICLVAAWFTRRAGRAASARTGESRQEAQANRGEPG